MIKSQCITLYGGKINKTYLNILYYIIGRSEFSAIVTSIEYVDTHNHASGT